jgi:biotin synthase
MAKSKKRGEKENMLAKESPEYVRTSLASAITLGLKEGIFFRNAKLHCINLLLTYNDGCQANCAYCGLAREREGRYNNKSFIRVDWPIYGIDEIISSYKNKKNEIRRFCISMITRKRAVDDTIRILEKLRMQLKDIPVSVLASPTVMKKEDAATLKSVGADKIGIAIDCATPDIFDEFRGKGVSGPHLWDKYWEFFEECVNIFGKDNAGVHLIVGLGETEEEMLKTIQKVRDMGGMTHLFSFFPETNSKLQDRPQPLPGHFRRIQLGRYLIDNDVTRAENFEFDKGKVVSYGLNESKLNKIINSGEPFMTSGCAGKDGKVDCNRPYGNSRPGDDIRNYPFIPDKEDIEKINRQLKTY